MTTLYIVRHGETDYNKEGRYLGRTDLPLNSAGISQARELTKQVRNFRIDIVISSPLKRTLETARIIAPSYKISTDNHFVERSLGVYEGLTKQAAKQKYSDLYQKVITRIFNQAPSKGETIKQVQDRVFRGIDEIKRKYSDKNILLVTHAFIAKIVNKYFHPDLSDEEFFNFLLPLIGVKKFILS